MKTMIRASIYETNSSSVHSLVIVPEEVYDKWQEDELYLYTPDHEYCYNKKDIPADKRPKEGHLYTEEEARKFLEYFNDWPYELKLRDIGLYKFTTWNDPDGDYEEDEYYYKTESGEDLVVRMYFGQNY